MSSSTSPRKSFNYPSLHLGSFDNIQEAGIPSSSGSRASSHRIQQTSSATFQPISRQSSHASSGYQKSSAHAETSPPNAIDMPGGFPSVGSTLPLNVPRRTTSRSSSSTQQQQQQQQQQTLPSSSSHASSLLPSPPGLSLPPLPSISPISFGLASSPASSATPTAAKKHSNDSIQPSGPAGPLPVPPVPTATINLNDDGSPAPPPSAILASTPSPSPPKRSDEKRASGPGLSVQIPRSPSPTPLPRSADELLTVRDSPSMARRRKVVEANPAMRIVSGRAAAVGDISPEDDSPLSPTDRNTIDSGSISMPVAQPHVAAPQGLQGDYRASQVSAKSQASQSSFKSAVSDMQDTPVSPRKLEKKPSVHDLTSPGNSPTPRRSLPRPPVSTRAGAPPPLNLGTVQRPAGAASPALNGAAESSGVFGPSTTLTQSGSIGRAGPSTTNTFGPSGGSRQLATGFNSQPLTQPLQSPDLPQIAPRARHVPTKSASSMPIVGGLADAGPYPSASPNPPQLGAMPANPTIGLGRPGQPPSGSTRRKPQEEICIECMMRDRDLADVDVTGEHVWDRQSDVAFEEKKMREEEILRSLGGSDSRPPSAIPSLDHSLESDDDDLSVPSTHDSVEDVEAKRRAALRKEQKRARRREVDWRLVNAVGWRGFKWEEGDKGEGLPRGFRGTRGGPLSEAGIKQIMLKFPSGSAHRAMHMERYLYCQALLVREVRQNAERLGYYPGPDDSPVKASVSSSEGHAIIAGPRTSSVAWGAKRDINEQMRSAFDGLGSTQASPNPNTAQTTVRPSPSSPANLAGMASKRVQVPPLNRPLTSFLPDREPAPPRSPVSARTNQRKSYASSKVYEQSMLNDTEEFVDGGDDPAWPPLSPAESGLRPFSFAVRAGATAGRGSSDGHGARRSLLGRWGGSVTSFFGGSQGGSASVIDMHLGLDSERQQQTSSNYVHGQTRAVSMASPTRPAFFSRDTRSASTDDRDRRVPKSLSTSRLSQAFLNNPTPTNANTPIALDSSSTSPPEKKKGLKGLLQKMKPKGGHKKSRSQSQSPQIGSQPRAEAYNQPGAGRLAPPPPMSYLANASSRDSQGRDRSSSTSTMYTDNSGAVHPAQRGTTVLPYNGGFRSVSAPGDSSSNGSQSNSPTDSRFKRDSYASGREEYDRERRTSGMEILAGGTKGGITQVGAYPSHALRPHNNKTTSSLSTTSVYPTVETPSSAVNGASAFFAQDNRDPGSPNRFKNLPPIPPPGAALSSSPESFNTPFADAAQHEYQVNGSSGYRQPIPPQQQQQQYHLPQQHHVNPSPRGSFPSTHSGSVPGSIPGSPYAPPRASYDALNDRGSPKVRVDARMAQSMYIDSSHPSLGPVIGQPYGQIHVGGPRVSHGNDMWTPMREDDGASVKKAKGLKGLFGAKAGRVA